MPEQEREKIPLPAESVSLKTADGEYSQSFFGEPLVGLDPAELNGTLIVIEGLDGSGRSTQIALLQEWHGTSARLSEQLGLRFFSHSGEVNRQTFAT